MFSISIDGRDSFNDFGLIVENRPDIPLPKKLYTTVKVPGATGEYRSERGYEDIEFDITFSMISRLRDFEENKFEIVKWLENRKDNKLYLSELEEYCYIIKSLEISDFKVKSYNREINEFTVTCICSPFKEYIINEPISIDFTSNNEMSFYNSENIFLNPKVIIYGSGTCNFKINEELIELKNINKNIVIDSENMECYSGLENTNSLMKGSFPRFEIGESNISVNKISGEFTKVEIYPNRRRI